MGPPPRWDSPRFKARRGWALGGPLLGDLPPLGSGPTSDQGFGWVFPINARKEKEKIPQAQPWSPGDTGSSRGMKGPLWGAPRWSRMRPPAPPPGGGGEVGSRTPKASGGIQRRAEGCGGGKPALRAAPGPARSPCPSEISPAMDGDSSPGSSQTPSERSQLLGEPGPPAPSARRRFMCQPGIPGAPGASRASPVLPSGASSLLCCPQSCPGSHGDNGDIHGTSAGDRVTPPGAQQGLVSVRAPCPCPSVAGGWQGKRGGAGTATSCCWSESRAGKESATTEPSAPSLASVSPGVLVRSVTLPVAGRRQGAAATPARGSAGGG